MSKSVIKCQNSNKYQPRILNWWVLYKYIKRQSELSKLKQNHSLNMPFWRWKRSVFCHRNLEQSGLNSGWRYMIFPVYLALKSTSTFAVDEMCYMSIIWIRNKSSKCQPKVLYTTLNVKISHQVSKFKQIST